MQRSGQVAMLDIMGIWPCPNCGASDSDISVLRLKDGIEIAPGIDVYVGCGGCGMTGPKAGSRTMAVNAWSRISQMAQVNRELVAALDAFREASRYTECEREWRRVVAALARAKEVK